MIRKATSDEVCRLRDATGESLVDCRKILNAHFIHQAIKEAEILDDIKQILMVIHHPPTMMGYMTQAIELVLKDSE